MECVSCVRIFEEVGDAFNSTLGTEEKLEKVASAIVKYLDINACHFRVLSRDQRLLEHVASFGLSTDEVESRLAKLSDEDIRHLASNLDQIQAAGEQVPEYIWWLAGGLLAVLILAAIL